MSFGSAFLRTLYCVTFALTCAAFYTKNVHAQYSRPYPPLVMCNGGWIPQGTPCGTGNGIVVPQGMSFGQPFVTNVGGVQRRCTLLDRAASGGVGLVIGSLGAYTVNRITQRGVIDRTGAAVGSALLGATLMCDPDIVNDEPERNVITSGGGVYSQQGVGTSASRPGKCEFANGVVAYTYEGQAGCEKIAAKMASAPTNSGATQVAQSTSGEQRYCAVGKTWAKLNWPGHPQHDTFACLPPDAPHY